MHVWNVLHAYRWKYRTQKWRKKSPSGHHHTTLSGYIFTTKARIGSQKKKLKQRYLLHISSQYGKLQPTSGWDRFGSLGHPSKFQRVSRLGFITALTSLSAGQPNFARCLAISCSGTLYIHFKGSCPILVTEFCQVQNSRCIQFLHSFILAALLYGTRALGVS